MDRVQCRASLLAIASLAVLMLWLWRSAAGTGVLASAQDQAGPARRLTKVTERDRHGFIDETGQVVVPIEYADAGDFSEGLARVKQHNKWGFVDLTGRVVIPIRFDCADDFSEGLARVTVGKKFGFIDRSGKLAIQAKFDFESRDGTALVSIPRFSEGLAPVVLGGKCGYIDKAGAVVIAPAFASAEPFSDGLALVDAGSRGEIRMGFIDKSGKFAIAPRFKVAESFSEGLARVRVETGGRSLYGYINKKGETVIAPQFDFALPFSEGLAPVGWGMLVNLQQKQTPQSYGCISDREGGIGSLPRLLPSRPPEHGTAAFIGSDGRTVNRPVSVDLGQFSEGLAPVRFKQGWGYVNKTLNVVIRAQFESAYPFSNGLAQVRIDDKQAFIDHDG